MMKHTPIPTALRLPALLLAALLMAAAPVAAQDSPEESIQDEGAQEGTQEEDGNALPEEARTLIQEMLARLSESMAGLVDILPRYGMPRINEEGDIVIPRLDEAPREEPDRNGTNNTEDTEGAREI
ncbi:hypothetical protein [Fodinicurvata sediminis]|uniref:hypothetical protein n=1 Tax=Fodinicurvata sediminis TaxID=1121832 RepID=UPI0003B7283D|nr:hypothetical protein [Fodinicurvata sediminis]